MATPTISSYDLINKLKRTPAQISIFKLLELSPLHKEILKKSLRTTNIPMDVDDDKFQDMMNHISSSHYLTFSKENYKSLSHPHNLALHI